MKNPFKLKNVISSATAIALGGAGNVAMDYAFANIPFLQTLGTDGGATPTTTKNAIKVVVGAVGGSLVPTKYGWAKSALDGTAIVGASELISSLINESEPTSGAPFIGRVRMGQRGFRVARKGAVRGTGVVPFMG